MKKLLSNRYFQFAVDLIVLVVVAWSCSHLNQLPCYVVFAVIVAGLINLKPVVKSFLKIK